MRLMEREEVEPQGEDWAAPVPELVAALPICASSYLLVTQQQQLMKGNTFHSNGAAPSSPLC